MNFRMVFGSFVGDLLATARSLSGIRGEQCELAKKCPKQNGIERNFAFRPRENPAARERLARVVQCA